MVIVNARIEMMIIMKKTKMNLNILKFVLVFNSILFVALFPSYSLSSTTDQVIELKNVSHTENTALLEFDQKVDYYLSSGENLVLILLYGDSESFKGIIIIEFNTDNTTNAQYSINDPVSDAYIWMDFSLESIQKDGNALFIDFLNYNIQVGKPERVKALALSSSDTFEDIISQYSSIINQFSDNFQESGSISYTSSSKTSISSTDDNLISDTFGFEILPIFLCLIGLTLMKKMKK